MSLSACATVNITGDETVSGLTRAQQELRVRAARLSKTVWQGMKEASFMSKMAGMLLNGKDEEDGPGLVADPNKRYSEVAVAYMEQTEQAHATADAQLDAIVRDVRAKTQQAAALVKAAKVLITDYQETGVAEQNDVVMASASSSEVVRGIAVARADKSLLDQTIERAKAQASTFAWTREAYESKYPSADTQRLAAELESFDAEIQRIVAMSNELAVVTDVS